MPNRAHMEVPPANRFERAEWLDERLPRMLTRIPMELGWGGVAALEREVFPSVQSDFLGGTLDPACPACGVETEEGTFERVGELWRVTYRSCGDVFDLTESELRARVRPHAGNA